MSSTAPLNTGLSAASTPLHALSCRTSLRETFPPFRSWFIVCFASTATDGRSHTLINKPHDSQDSLRSSPVVITLRISDANSCHPASSYTESVFRAGCTEGPFRTGETGWTRLRSVSWSDSGLPISQPTPPDPREWIPEKEEENSDPMGLLYIRSTRRTHPSRTSQ